MTFRAKIDQILDEYFFKPYNITPTYGASNSIVNEVTQAIDELAAHERKGFCTKTANKIKNRINANGDQVSPEPKN